MESTPASSAAVRRFGEIVESGVLEATDGPLAEPLAVIAAAVAGRPLSIVDGVARELDELASGVARDDVLSVSLALFVGDRAFAGNRVDYHDPANSLIDRVLSTRRGIPISLSAVLIEVGRRRGVDLVGVGMPAHFLTAVRPRPGESPSTFVDAFNRGRFLDAEGCANLFRTMVGPGHPFDPRYLDPVNASAVVERTLSNLKSVFAARGDVGRLRTVMSLRARLPWLAEAERDEFRRLMARLN